MITPREDGTPLKPADSGCTSAAAPVFEILP
jgi:hypothetical protein